MVHDAIGDMLTIIRNGYLAKLSRVKVMNSKMARALCVVLEKEGFIQSWSEKEREISVKLKYVYNDDALTKAPALTKVDRVSTPGKRVYSTGKGLPRVRGGLGVHILSTSKGVMSSKEAVKLGLGGEVICKCW
jgi:small subunit ribosomal protein S8